MIGGFPPDENCVAIFRCLSMTWHEARLSTIVSLYINNFNQNSVACPSRRFPTKSIVNLPKVAVTLGNFSCNFSRNFVATQVALKLFKCNITRQELVSQVFVGTSVEELDATFHNDCGNDLIDFFSVTQCNTPRATCLAMLCSISQSGSLLSSPRSSSVAVLRVADSLIAQCKTHVRAVVMLRF